jgi:hypothetical protein
MMPTKLYLPPEYEAKRPSSDELRWTKESQKQYRMFADVFSNKELKKFPLKRPWDHKIELKPGAPATLISKTIKLSTTEQQELQAFINEHLERGMIKRSKSPYVASFFFIKKKNGKLRPVQDYQPINEWTIKIDIPYPSSHS